MYTVPYIDNNFKPILFLEMTDVRGHVVNYSLSTITRHFTISYEHKMFITERRDIVRIYDRKYVYVVYLPHAKADESLGFWAVVVAFKSQRGVVRETGRKVQIKFRTSFLKLSLIFCGTFFSNSFARRGTFPIFMQTSERIYLLCCI